MRIYILIIFCSFFKNQFLSQTNDFTKFDDKIKSNFILLAERQYPQSTKLMLLGIFLGFLLYILYKYFPELNKNSSGSSSNFFLGIFILAIILFVSSVYIKINHFINF